jgi:glycosyltransferase involved in cell wall biosynthesis
LGFYERIHGLLRDLSEYLKIPFLVCNSPTHGGYTLVKCSPFFHKITVSNIEPQHLTNINNNLIHHEIKNIFWFDPVLERNNHFLYFSENTDTMDMDWIQKYEPLILCPLNLSLFKNPILQTLYPSHFQLSNTNMVLMIPTKWDTSFKQEFSSFLSPERPYEFTYDNLIELCIMVKNGGDQFEETLKANLHLVDRWTILDTGSTDNTLEIIEKVLGNKRGKLFQEPFLNFRDSRNRCLELAGTKCKYTLMLDDTYRIQGDLRKFLNTVRGDQFSDSFSFFVQSEDMQYTSNRVLNTEKKLKYLYKIHEVIQTDNNINVIIPQHVTNIFDYRCQYMETRTMERKQYDLKILLEEVEENPNDPRCYYYIAQTYIILEKYELAYEYFLKRGFHPVEGFIQEKIDAFFEAARTANFKLNKPWEECEKLYNIAYELDKSRPDSLYFLGIHYYLEKNMRTAFDYLKKAYENGYPLHCQYSLKPTLSFHFLPKFLVELCILFGEYKLGKEVAELFLRSNEKGSEFYENMEEWYNLIISKLSVSDSSDKGDENIKVEFIETDIIE